MSTPPPDLQPRPPVGISPSETAPAAPAAPAASGPPVDAFKKQERDLIAALGSSDSDDPEPGAAMAGATGIDRSHAAQTAAARPNPEPDPEPKPTPEPRPEPRPESSHEVAAADDDRRGGRADIGPNEGATWATPEAGAHALSRGMDAPERAIPQNLTHPSEPGSDPSWATSHNPDQGAKQKQSDMYANVDADPDAHANVNANDYAERDGTDGELEDDGAGDNDSSADDDAVVGVEKLRTLPPGIAASLARLAGVDLDDDGTPQPPKGCVDHTTGPDQRRRGDDDQPSRQDVAEQTGSDDLLRRFRS